MGLQCYKLVFQETESISFWILTAQMAVVLVHFKEKKYEIYESSDAAFNSEELELETVSEEINVFCRKRASLHFKESFLANRLGLLNTCHT